MTDETLIKFINKELAQAERQKVIRWIEASNENRKRYNLLKARDTVAKFNTPHLDIDKSYREVIEKTKKRKQTAPVWMRVAAAVILLASTWFVWDLTTETTKPKPGKVDEVDEQISITDKGENTEILLPDGSKVQLNADSRLTWSPNFSDSIRQIHLSGEAFFDVAHDSQRPFIVHTENLDVTVLGTTFNVRAYPDDEKPVTTLVSGIVELSGKTNKPVTLQPMQAAVLDKNTEQFEIEDVSEFEAAPWREGKLLFQDTPLEKVVRDIERKYDVECYIDSSELNGFLFTGTFDNLTIDEVLRVLKISSDINYNKDGKKIELFLE